MKSYGARRYSEAINQFGAAEKQYPTDPSIHYYMGLCYQAQNQMSLAKQEFAWVGQNGSGVLRNQANTALQNISRYTSQTSTEVAVAPANDGFTATKVPKIEKKFQGRLKVLEFSTSWCHVCRDFEPIWQNTASRMGSKADFRQLDAEDPSNSNLVSRYSVKAYPTFVYSDDTGNMLSSHRGSYSDANEFQDAINHFFIQ